MRRDNGQSHVRVARRAWRGCFCGRARGCARAHLKKISADIRAVVTSPVFAERTKALGIVIWGTTPKELDAWFASETAKWAEITKAANLKAEP